YHGYYQHKIAQVTQSNLAKQSDKNAKLQQASTDFDTKCQTLLQKYKQKKLNLTQKALSNCLVASTIYLKELQRLEDEYNQQVNSVTQAHQQAVSKLNYQLQLLQQLLQDATQHLQGQQEAKTAQKMFDLQLDEQKRSDSVTKYNNSVDKQETDYKVKIEKAYATVTAAEQSRALQAINLLATVGVSGVEKLKSEEKVALARPFFDTLSRVEAQQLFSSDVSLEYHFGTYYDYMKEYVDNLPN
ncbi:MAG: hypothetical protein IKC47_01705, partial [Clostridia bacterium]|nr:hypothetical protein [Clostridia bacterium]